MSARRSLVVSLALAAACGGRDDLDGRRHPVRGLADGGVPYVVPLDGLEVAYDLYDNRAAASVSIDGALVLDCGGADFAKYVEGGLRSPWRLGVDDGGARVALVPGLGGTLRFSLDGDDGSARRGADGSLTISFSARPARPHQVASVFLDEQRLGEIAMNDTALSDYRISAPAAAVRPGENRLRFFFRYRGEIAGEATAAALARIAIGGGGLPDRDAPALTAEEATRGGARADALRVAAPTRLSYSTALPAGAPELRFAYAGPHAHLTVRVAAAAGGSQIAWSGDGTAVWQSARVDLAPWAGQIVRLDLLSSAAADWGRPRIVVTPAAPPSAPRPVADHVIIWTVSSLRADRVGAGLAPAFDRAAAAGARFTRARAAAPVPALAHVAMMTGTYPRSARIPDEAVTLAERFRDAGFRTALLSGNGFVSDEDGFAQGFDLYENPMRRRRPNGARVLWQSARRLLAEGKDGHVFLYLATSEPHLPYTPSREALAAEWHVGPMRFDPAETAVLADAVRAGREHLSAEERAFVTALYAAEVRDADAAFADMMKDLVDLGVAGRTAVILVGDHGEALWERGAVGHGDSLYEEELAIPLVVWMPGAIAPRALAVDVEQVDVYATALDLAGIAVNPESQGASLLPWAIGAEPLLPEPAFARLPGYGRAVVIGGYKLVLPFAGPDLLFDLAADPGERDNRLGRAPLVEDYLRDVLGLEVAYEPAWRRGRWGSPANVTPAFAADQGR